MHLGAASVDCVAGVELPDACGPLLGTNSSRTPNTVDVYSGSESAGDKLRRREGDSPDRRLRSRSGCEVGKDVESHRQPGGWLRSSHPLKSA